MFHSQGLSRETMRSLNRCRVSLESIFLSDLTTPDGRYLEHFVFNPGGRNRLSSFMFPREIPTREDENEWFNFWQNFTTTGNKLKVPLGNWINPTHRIWEWYYREDSDDLWRVKCNTVFHYKLAAGLRFTQSTRTYHMSHKEPLLPNIDHGLPISVAGLAKQQVVKLSTAHIRFWDFLYSWGGTWMWEVMEYGKDTPVDIQWLVDGLCNGTSIWATDGSYDRKKAADLCGLGWMVYCTNTGFRVTGTFWERSTSASLYRAELLGLCALHLFSQALAEYHNITGTTNVHWRYPLIPHNASDLVQSAPTYAAVSRRSDRFSTAPFNTFTSTVIWTIC